MAANQPFSEPVIKYLEAAVIPMRLGVNTDSGWPLVISLWYIQLDGYLYCATQSSARVVSYLQADERCGFEVAADLPPYCGVRGLARAEILPKRGDEILRQLLERYLGGTDNNLAARLLKRGKTEVALRLEPVYWTTWNFSQRMAGSVPPDPTKPCPP